MFWWYKGFYELLAPDVEVWVWVGTRVWHSQECPLGFCCVDTQRLFFFLMQVFCIIESE